MQSNPSMQSPYQPSNARQLQSSYGGFPQHSMLGFNQHSSFTPSSFSSSYTSRGGSPTTAFAAYANSPSANPPPTFLHRNSFGSLDTRTGFLRGGMDDGIVGTSATARGSSGAVVGENAGVAPACGRRSLLTSKLQAERHDETPAMPNTAMPAQGFNATSFPQPTPATATTNVSRDIAFSTTSSSSGTLYQENPAVQEQADQPVGQNAWLPGRGAGYRIPRPLHLQQYSLQASQQYPHFVSASAPVHTMNSGAASATAMGQSYGNGEPQQQRQQQSQMSVPQPQMSAPHLPEEEHLNIADHPVQDLLLMLSALLQKIVEANDLLHTENAPETPKDTGGDSPLSLSANSSAMKVNVLAFHGRNIPAISLHAYLTRILKYCPVTNDVFLCLLVYFDRIARRANNPPSGGGRQAFVIDSYNIHRLIISGITVASKFFSDIFYKNSRYAKVGGLPLGELNHLEIQFLLLLDFHLMIQVEEMNRYGDLLLRFWRREHKQ